MKRVNDNGFSLVELIIVVAIMSVLVGVMAPQYVKYLERTKCTRDCTAISTVLDACETMGLDPDTTWGDGTANQITITISSGSVAYSGGASSELDEYVPGANIKLEDDGWGTITIYAIKSADSSVDFDISDNGQITRISRYSPDVANRLY